MNFVQNQYAGQREQRGAVWLTAQGSNEVHSVSSAVNPDDGSTANVYTQIVEGTVVAKRDDTGLHYPCAADAAQATVTTANSIVVADVLQFAIGQLVELPTSVSANAARFRLVTAINYDTSTITLDGATFSLTTGQAIEVDAGRSVVLAAGAVSSSTALVVSAGDAAKLAVGDTLSFAADTDKTITAIAGTAVTLSGTISIADGSRIVSNSDGDYKITNKTVTIDENDFLPQNVLIPIRPHGRVKEILVVGLTATSKAALESLIIFDARTIA